MLFVKVHSKAYVPIVRYNHVVYEDLNAFLVEFRSRLLYYMLSLTALPPISPHGIGSLIFGCVMKLSSTSDNKLASMKGFLTSEVRQVIAYVFLL